MTQHAVVALSDGTITSITLDKYLASQMTILEECDESALEEKIAYWDRIYNYKPKPDTPMYHFFDEKRNRHVWSIYSDLSHTRLRHKNDFKLIETP